MTKKEKYFLKNIIYCNECDKKTYNYYGAIENVQSYLQEKLIGENDAKFIKILIKIINKVGKCYPNKTHIWLAIRANNSYIWKDVRWHTDGNYYDHGDEPHSKFIATLCGDETYGINASQSDMELYRELNREMIAGIITREEFLQKLSDQFTPKKININYSIIKVGTNSNDCRQIHSEPVNIIPNKRRVFISILYGTEGEIIK